MARKSKGTLYLRGKTYWLEYYVNGRRIRTSLDTADKREAERKRDEAIAPLAVADEAVKLKNLVHSLSDAETQLADLRESQREKLTIDQAWEAYTADPGRPQSGPATLSDFAQRWAKFSKWASAEGVLLMEDVTPAAVKRFAVSLGKLSPNRYNKIFQTCRLVFRVLAGRCNYMPNPFDRAVVAAKPLATKAHRELSEAELRVVCGAAKGEMRILFAVGLYTALRLGDAATLRWDEVSFALNRITRMPNKTRRTGKTLAIPLHPVLRSILEETPEADRRDAVMPRFAEIYTRDRGSLSHLVQEHFRVSKIKTTERPSGQVRATCRVGFHSLRHSFVSICAAAGVPLAVVQELCGHGSPAIQRKYIHLGVEATQAAINALPAITGPESPAPAKPDSELRAELRRFAETGNIATVKQALRLFVETPARG